MTTTHDGTTSEGVRVFDPDPLRQSLGLYTEDEFARAMGVEIETAQNWRKEGNSPDFIKQGKKIFYRLDDIKDWIKRNLQVNARRK